MKKIGVAIAVISMVMMSMLFNSAMAQQYRGERKAQGAKGYRMRTFDPTTVEILKGEAILRLRDKNGFPVWSGWRRK